MRNRQIKFMAIIIMIFCIIYMKSPFTYASIYDLFDSIREESGEMPPPPTLPDEPETPGNGTNETNTYHIYYEKISGNVYEEIDDYFSNSTTATDSNPINIGAEGIAVQLINQNNEVIDTVVTGKDGNYSFSPEEGTYSVRFIYGNIENKGNSSIEKVLKYNGHDYIAIKTPGANEYIDTKKIEITNSGKGCAQVFIALDCSYSMRNTNIKMYNETKTRLEIAVDSAKRLINSLLDRGENIYVGLIFFSGTNYRARSLTQDSEILNKDLDSILQNNWYTANTNIVGALDKAKNSFKNQDKNNSNRTVVVISDGIPTSSGSTEIYNTDSYETIQDKLYNIIAPDTKNKVAELKNDGIRIISLFAKSDVKEENDLVKDIFGEADSFYSIQDGQETINTITQDIKKYLIDTTEEKEYTDSIFILAGHEDKDRRKTVDDYFNGTFYYNSEDGIKTSLFKQIDEYNSLDEAKELSNLTYMIVEGGKNYQITKNPHYDGYREEKKWEENVIDPSTGEEHIVEHVEAEIWKSSEYSNQNLILKQRPTMHLSLNVTATGLKIVLNDGHVYYDETREVMSDMVLIKSLAEELAHGATIEVEYTISIRNNSSIQCNYLELIDYLPEGFLYSENTELITEDGIYNKNLGWQLVSLQELNEKGFITNSTYRKYRDRRSVKIVLDNAGQGENGFYISPGGNYEIKLVASRIIGQMSDTDLLNDDGKNPNAVEILGYRNNSNRRMAKAMTEEVLSGGRTSFISWIKGMFPGDGMDEDFTDKTTNSAKVVPPTGKEINIVKIMIIGIILLVIMIIYKKTHKKSKMN